MAEGLVLSGIAMGIAGTSRPCSGSEHLLSHAYNQLNPNPKIKSLHGEQVALFALFTSLLQKEPTQKRQVDFLKSNHLLSSPQEIEIDLKRFKDLIKLAPLTRPGRFTILNETDQSCLENIFLSAYEN
jgi:glycerol-1-phosphate dehydrogenase [NAD(P)+]